MTRGQRGLAAWLMFSSAGALAATGLQESVQWSAKEAAMAIVLEGATWSASTGRLVVVAAKLAAKPVPGRRSQALVFDGARGFLTSLGLESEPAAAAPVPAAAAPAASGAWAKLLEALGYGSSEPGSAAEGASDRPAAATRAARGTDLLGGGGDQGLEGLAIGGDDSIVAFGKHNGAPFASKVGRGGELAWAKPVTRIADGFVAAAVPDRDGGTYLAVVAIGERPAAGSASSVEVVRMDSRGETVARRQVPGDSCGMVRDARGVSLVVGNGGEWSILHLSPTLEPLDRHALDFKIGGLWRVAAAAVGNDRIAVLDIDHQQPRITIVDANGKTVLSKRLEQPGLLPTLEMQLVAGGAGDLYVVVPELPALDAAGEVRSGVRVLKLRVTD